MKRNKGLDRPRSERANRLNGSCITIGVDSTQSTQANGMHFPQKKPSELWGVQTRGPRIDKWNGQKVA